MERGQGAEVNVAGRKRLYRHAVRAGDEVLEGLLNSIKRRKARRPSLVIITSDHGEGFGDRGPVGHGRSLRNEAYHVPLVIVGPGFPAGIKYTYPLSARRVPGTILRTLDPHVTGTLEELIAKPNPNESILIWFPRGSVIQKGNWRLIFTELKHMLNRPTSWAHRKRVELYDLSSDPDERNSIAEETPTKVEALLQELMKPPNVPQSTIDAVTDYLAHHREPHLSP